MTRGLWQGVAPSLVVEGLAKSLGLVEQEPPVVLELWCVAVVMDGGLCPSVAAAASTVFVA